MYGWEFVDEVQQFEIQLFLKQPRDQFLQEAHGIFSNAVKNQKYKLVKTMLEHDPKRVLSRTKALNDAAFSDDPYMVRILVDHGANPKARRSLALRIAMRLNHDRAADTLRECGAAIPPKRPPPALQRFHVRLFGWLNTIYFWVQNCKIKCHPSFILLLLRPLLVVCRRLLCNYNSSQPCWSDLGVMSGMAVLYRIDVPRKHHDRLHTIFSPKLFVEAVHGSKVPERMTYTARQDTWLIVDTCDIHPAV